MSKSVGNQPKGFTLLELLVALAIFGLLSVMSYSGLSTVMNQQAHTAEAATRLGDLQKIYLIMQRDFEQIVPRAVRGEFGDELPALVGNEEIQFTRGGWSNPLGQPRSNLQRIRYAFEDSQLVRFVWLVLDRAQDSLPLRQPLTEAVTNMSIRYLSDKKAWQSSWSGVSKSGGPQVIVGGATVSGKNVLPRAIEVTLEHAHFGELVWLFRLPS